MTAIALKTQPDVATRLLAGVLAESTKLWRQRRVCNGMAVVGGSNERRKSGIIDNNG